MITKLNIINFLNKNRPKGLTNKGLCVKIFNCVEPHSTTAQKRYLTVTTLMASLRLLKEENMKAVIETGGKQYYVEEGTVLYVEKLDKVKNLLLIKF